MVKALPKRARDLNTGPVDHPCDGLAVATALHTQEASPNQANRSKEPTVSTETVPVELKPAYETIRTHRETILAELQALNQALDALEATIRALERNQ